jgi:hypothetical protein
MNVTMAYLGRSRLTGEGPGRALALMPNLARDPVAFDAALKQPLRFREAISALHDVVVSDLRYKPRDKSAYEEWKRQENQRLQKMYREEYKRAKEAKLDEHGITPDMERQFKQAVKRYWGVRLSYSNYLTRNDPELWRLLMPCDPVITVADDVVFFECFSADESSYGCLTVDRVDGFGRSENLQYGTTNVDYSWQLYDHFQALRTYRETRLQVDPSGFDVKTAGHEDYREEKIDLPEGWLRGFMQIQTAMTLPMRRVSLSRECVYSLLAWLKRHRAKKSPRALRFELAPGASPRLVLEPWDQWFISHGTKYDGPSIAPIRVWGTRRLLFLSRILPLVDRFDVYLLGTGFPAFWVARMGEMRLTIGNSGWTTNDWTHGSAIDALRAPEAPGDDFVGRVASRVRDARAVRLEDLASRLVTRPAACLAALDRLAHTGQVIFDLDAGVYRWRQVMSQALGERELGPENPEFAAARQLLAKRKVHVQSKQSGPTGSLLIQAQVDNQGVEVFVNGDGQITRGKCKCSHHYKGGIRMGPCRHLLAARDAAMEKDETKPSTLDNWYERLRTWSQN